MGQLPAKASARKDAPPRRATMLALATVAVGIAVGTAFAVEVRATNGHLLPHLRYHLLAAALPGLLLLVAGLLFWTRQPHNRLGPLLFLDSIAQHLWALVFVPIPAIVTAGLLLQEMNVAVAVHVTLAWPSGRLHPGADRVIVGLFYVGAVMARGLTAGLGPGIEGNLLHPRDMAHDHQRCSLH